MGGPHNILEYRGRAGKDTAESTIVRSFEGIVKSIRFERAQKYAVDEGELTESLG